MVSGLFGQVVGLRSLNISNRLLFVGNTTFCNIGSCFPTANSLLSCLFNTKYYSCSAFHQRCRKMLVTAQMSFSCYMFVHQPNTQANFFSFSNGLRSCNATVSLFHRIYDCKTSWDWSALTLYCFSLQGDWNNENFFIFIFPPLRAAIPYSQDELPLLLLHALKTNPK